MRGLAKIGRRPQFPVPLVSILGPLGNGFTIFPDRPAAVLIGGGVGVPPMIDLGQALAAAGKKVVAFCGARTAGMIPLTPHRNRVSAAGEPSALRGEFAEIGVPAVLAPRMTDRWAFPAPSPRRWTAGSRRPLARQRPGGLLLRP